MPLTQTVTYKVVAISGAVAGLFGIALQLRDANNVNQSAATIPVSALQVLDGSGTVVRILNTHFLFVRGGRDDLPGSFYVYGFSARDLPKGSYTVTYQAGADPPIYHATFLR